MNSILIAREEIICLIILLFIVLYSSFYKMGKDQGNFLRICVFAIGHVVFDIATVLTVNNLDVVPEWINRGCHIIFYLFALLFSYEFFCYTVLLSCPKNVYRSVRRIGLVPLILYAVAVPFLPMVYLEGRGTNYSFGTAAIVGYGVAMLFFVASVFIVLKYRRKLDKYIFGSLMPMLCAAIAFESLQIVIPELLFTGGAVTIITLGFFFSLENPIAALRQKVLIDAMTGVKSRHSYEADIVVMERKFAAGEKFGVVFCDINDLKIINDTRGHSEGDAYIGCVAQLLMEHLKSAETVYRMGGDEFMAIYQGNNIGKLTDEVKVLDAACEKQSEHQDYPISLAFGYAFSDNTYKSLRDVIRTADFRMYASKEKAKQQRAYMLDEASSLNIVGLTDRIFDAFSSTDSNRFLFVSNMTTNVTRWSHSAVEYFGFSGEFIYDFSSLWTARVHPDDREAYENDIKAVLSGRQNYHDITFRVTNGIGDYVTCSCTGTVLRGKNDEPDLFAGTMFVVSDGESIDHITDLRNGREMMNYFNYLIRNNIPAAMLKISILNLSRINMLYGYANGNEILKQFAVLMHNIVGGDGSVFRSDGTRFVICMPNVERVEITEIYRKIQLAAEQRIRLEAVTPPLQLAAGAYMLPSHFDGNGSVIRSNLIFAHTKSKYSEHGRIVFYDSLSGNTDDLESKNKLLLSIHQDAISGYSGFRLLYQPIVSVETGRIVGAEALLRWKDDVYGVVSPKHFIPWLEGDPCFFGLGNWILKNALTDAKQILEYAPDFIINVNIAMPQLEHESFRGGVLNALKDAGFPQKQLCLELTERCRELSTDFLKGEVEFFREKGIRVALDDLGTGFSSFGLLLALNVDEIKLDCSFIKEIQTKRVNQVLTKMLIETSKSMGYSICLEGIEDAELCHYLSDYGATYYQGYYCAKPMSVSDFIPHMREWNSSHGEPPKKEQK